MKLRILLWNVAMTPSPPPRMGTRNAKFRAIRIAALLNEYDVVVLNESFLYRDTLLKAVAHQYVYTEPRTWYKPLNSGVVILSKIPLFNLNYKHYTRAATWDWFTSKALIGCSFQVGGNTFDLYGTHMQAGNSAAAHAARQQQAVEIVEQVRKTHSQNHGLIICGDFNCGPTRDPEFKQFSVHYSDEADARIRSAQFNTILEGTGTAQLLQDPQDTDISSFLYKSGHGRARVQREAAPVILDEYGVSLSDTGPLCISIEFREK